MFDGGLRYAINFIQDEAWTRVKWLILIKDASEMQILT